ncbi:DHH family phosphoesterase [Solimonas marina]|uniref:DHH family phosphoesterase n=1 Tax=Solimonas marina TaxID=2714601 RepID=A0A969W9U0_9GAMM|nr:DHH family phosphoesterase [Solimonas marina]NKF23411.1 DHH family phosphoesterase [Solimonas marina]
MADIDVFNGDADGICALTQLRLAEPRDARLVTGVKRDIALLAQVEAGAGDRVTVLDISLDKNRDGVVRLLASGAELLYVDHHYAGELPTGERLTALINEAPDVCTSLLVNGHLKNRYLAWAVVGAFGDNLKKSAETMAKGLEINAEQLRQLEDLGTYLNYNGYGESVGDLHFAPDALFRLVSQHESPFGFIGGDGHEHFAKLADGYATDMGRAAATQPETTSTAHAALFILPDAPWARRVSGVYSNDLTNQHPDRAHAVLTEKANGHYLISVRAPLNRKKGADELCRQFPTGGGRAAAAGVNDLPADQLGAFTDAFTTQFAI